MRFGSLSRGASQALIATAITIAQVSPTRSDDPKLPLPLDGSPAQVFAAHKARASELARHYARTRKLNPQGEPATEDNTIALIAHLQAATDDPGFVAVAGGEPSLTLAPRALRAMNPGHGQVGTSFDSDLGGLISARKGDYDMALKGLMVAVYRYRNILSQDDVNFVLDRLVPTKLLGPHDPSIESYRLLPTETAPETENHLLMITSTRYLANQLMFDRTRDRRYDNTANGLAAWLTAYMQRIAQHDFLEFNARPYQRLSLHALLNLFEFARDVSVRTGAHNVLDYTMMKFAISSNRLRRVSPFRRLHENTNTVTKLNNILWDGFGGDPLTGFFLAYTGVVDPGGNPVEVFPDTWALNALITGLSTYRPPPAAYRLALNQDLPAFQHRFYHGLRPILPGTDDQGEGGLEIYARSSSFLLTAGGSFLNSGYGGDEFTKYKQTSIAQSTTLLPTRLDLDFADLIRFDPYPDNRRAVNNAVHRGFACGANLRPAARRILSHSSTHAPVLAAHDNGLFLGWKGSGNENLNVGQVIQSWRMQIEGVEGIAWNITLGDTTEEGPALASHGGRMVLAWKGSGNDNLNIAVSQDGGRTFPQKATFGDTSHLSPALAVHNNRLYLAWTGRGDGNLNVAKIVLIGNTAGGFDAALEGKVTLSETSDGAPALASHGGRLFLAWRGSGNENLNLIASGDDGATFGGKASFGDTSDHGPVLTSHGGRLLLAWTGEGAGNLNIAQVGLIGNTAGAFRVGGLENKVTLPETSDARPGLASANNRLVLAWKGSGNDNLNLATSPDGRFEPDGPWHFVNMRDQGFYVAVYRTVPAHPEALDTHLDSLGMVYAMEAGGMGFQDFRSRILQANGALPARLDYGGHYTFSTPDDRRFTCWLHPSLEKHRPRIALASEPNPVADFTQLPLAEGPFLRAPNGHDGLVEIRHPACENAPIVLDYRNSANPARTDNLAACPQPWAERVAALDAFAGRLDAVGKSKLALTARADGAEIRERLAAVGGVTPGPASPTAMLAALARAGIDYSVPERDLLSWLNEPRYTPYPALAQAMLKLLDGRSLKQPVFLDVIAYNYEHAPGTTSPRKVEEVQPNILKAAVLEGYKVRYGASVSNFDSLLR